MESESPIYPHAISKQLQHALEEPNLVLVICGLVAVDTLEIWWSAAAFNYTSVLGRLMPLFVQVKKCLVLGLVKTTKELNNVTEWRGFYGGIRILVGFCFAQLQNTVFRLGRKTGSRSNLAFSNLIAEQSTHTTFAIDRLNTNTDIELCLVVSNSRLLVLYK